jgi:DNA-binding NtrC family response regulator
MGRTERMERPSVSGAIQALPGNVRSVTVRHMVAATTSRVRGFKSLDVAFPSVLASWLVLGLENLEAPLAGSDHVVRRLSRRLREYLEHRDREIPDVRERGDARRPAARAQLARQPAEDDVIVQALEDIEREYIVADGESAGGNRTRAAVELGIGLATLRRKLRRYEAMAEGGQADARRRAR